MSKYAPIYCLKRFLTLTSNTRNTFLGVVGVTGEG